MTSALAWTAYVDECEAVLDGHLYSMAASLVDDAAIDAVADALLPLKFPGSAKLHWYEEHKSDRRKLLATTVAQLAGVEHVVVVLSTSPQGSSPNRRRKQCLMWLLPELHSLGVTRVLMEARESKQNTRDVETVFALRNQRRIRGPFKLEHAAGPSTPLLWVPDIAVGAVKDAYAGNSIYRDILASKLTEIVISP